MHFCNVISCQSAAATEIVNMTQVRITTASVQTIDVNGNFAIRTPIPSHSRQIILIPSYLQLYSHSRCNPNACSYALPFQLSCYFCLR